MKNGIDVDVPMVKYGHFASMIAMTTKAVKTNAQPITRYDKQIVPVK